MKLLFLLPIFKNTGPSNVVVSMINKLLTYQINITLVSFYPVQDNYQRKFTTKDVRLIELNGFNIKSLWALWRLIKKDKIDVVHSHCLLPDIANPLISLFNNNKKISTVHCNVKDNYRNEYSFPKGPVYHFLHRFALMCMDDVVSVSSSAKVSEKTPIIYNGIGQRTIERKKSNCLNLVFAGRLIESKNILFLLSCFNYLLEQKPTYIKEVKLHIFGDGELFNYITELNHQHIVMHGFVTDYVSKLPENSIMINPSLFEGMPMAVVEALSCGIPVVLSSIDAHQEIAKHIYNGVMLYDNTEKGFYQAIFALLNEQGVVTFDQNTMVKEYEAEFSDGVMAEKYLKVYKL